jgi:hypothetical protein
MARRRSVPTGKGLTVFTQQLKTCEKAKKILCRFPATPFRDSAIAKGEKALRFPRHHVWQSV